MNDYWNSRVPNQRRPLYFNHETRPLEHADKFRCIRRYHDPEPLAGWDACLRRRRHHERNRDCAQVVDNHR
ncbi:MAG: hypothetical protein ACRD1H_00105, partial [Vicinamibacterales bacterium]